MSTVERSNPVTPAEAEQAAQDALATIPRAKKLELFFNLCGSGKTIPQALQMSGIVAPSGYDPSQPEAELIVEEMFYTRCAAKVDKTRSKYPCGVIPDDEWDSADRRPGDLRKTQLYALVDWLYFVRAMPLIAIGKALQVPGKEIAIIKAELSNEFSKAIRMQHAEGYIGDLLRMKDLVKADLVMRRNGLGPRDAQAAIQIDKLIWEIENRFVDRLQEIGLIDKNLGKIDINEEWHVSIDTVSGAPVNKKLEAVLQEPFQDTEFSTNSSESDLQIADSSESDNLFDEPNAEQLLAALKNNSASIKIGS